jgi:hypothetical protein
MTATSKSADQQQKSQPNLGQKEAQQNRESDAELRRMGEKSEGSSEKSHGLKAAAAAHKHDR